ncbi:non-specific serine/threonine protein kinase [Ranunculus cassubicifolius]
MAVFSMIQMCLFLFTISCVKATYFNYTVFSPSSENEIDYLGDAYAADGKIQLTKSQVLESISMSVGRAIYRSPVRLWNSTTGEVADFNTHFTFQINLLNRSDPNGGDGLTFFLAANASLPPHSSGGALGLYNDSSKLSSSENPAVAIEFDTYGSPGNAWDPINDHVGIDINSVDSTATWLVPNLKNGSTAYVWVSYNSSTQNLSAYMTYDGSFVFSGESVLSSVVDFTTVLPEWVFVGFSASTGSSIEVHSLLSWELYFKNIPVMETDAPSPAPFPPSSAPFPSDNLPGEYPPSSESGGRRKRKINLKVEIGLVVSILLITAVVGLILFVLWKKRNEGKDDTIKQMSSDGDYESGTGGPRRFAYVELVRATNNFVDYGKLGEGGFGCVYKGILSDTNVEVAVKKVSKGSRQGKKEYISEVKIISQLRHRNLVQLLGWCHELGELLLVYEYMPNGSLDFHLFGGRTILSWVMRYKIALGLASGLLYLHEEWEQCVVHRDIKSSNIMLDSSFNAKLGDFGLARFVDHDVGVKTTMLAGTTGYMAPECHATGKAGKESDVYSFGVVALEIVSGRRVVEPKEEVSKVGLISWVWGLYGSGRLLEAADSKLGKDFNELQIERLLIVGLWCANLDYNLRPSIKQAISVLNFDAPLPYLPLKMSVPTHIMSSLHDLGLSYPSFSSGTENQGNQSQASSFFLTVKTRFY